MSFLVRAGAVEPGSGRCGVLVFTADHELHSADEQALALLGDTGLGDLRERAGRLFAGMQGISALLFDAKTVPIPLQQRALWRADGSPLPALIQLTQQDGKLVCRFSPLSAALPKETIEPRQSWIEAMLDISQSGLFITDLERCLYANRAFAELLGFADSAEVIGARCKRFIHADDWSRLDEFYRTADGGPESREATFRVRTRFQNAVRNVAIRILPVRYDGRPCFVGSATDVTDLHRNEAALHDYANRLQVVSRQVIEVQENERCNLARELHDEIGQQLTLLKIVLVRLQEDHALDLVEEAIASVDQLTSQVRDLSLDLRPSMLDDLGLAAALRWYVARAARLADIRPRLDIPPDFPRMRAGVETLFFRVAQEAVTNVLRHSCATSVSVRLGNDGDCVFLEVSDNGRGFDPEAARSSAMEGGSAGLLGMQERAALAGADLRVDSSDGNGTRLRLAIRSDMAH